NFRAEREEAIHTTLPRGGEAKKPSDRRGEKAAGEPQFAGDLHPSEVKRKRQFKSSTESFKIAVLLY
uniref:Uncharacterized protein n=3 Tax=Oryza TaxID=4527 RepID=A0A0E0PQZ9_ORYRU